MIDRSDVLKISGINVMYMGDIYCNKYYIVGDDYKQYVNEEGCMDIVKFLERAISNTFNLVEIYVVDHNTSNTFNIIVESINKFSYENVVKYNINGRDLTGGHFFIHSMLEIFIKCIENENHGMVESSYIFMKSFFANNDDEELLNIYMTSDTYLLDIKEYIERMRGKISPKYEEDVKLFEIFTKAINRIGTITKNHKHYSNISYIFSKLEDNNIVRIIKRYIVDKYRFTKSTYNFDIIDSTYTYYLSYKNGDISHKELVKTSHLIDVNTLNRLSNYIIDSYVFPSLILNLNDRNTNKKIIHLNNDQIEKYVDFFEKCFDAKFKLYKSVRSENKCISFGVFDLI